MIYNVIVTVNGEIKKTSEKYEGFNTFKKKG